MVSSSHHSSYGLAEQRDILETVQGKRILVAGAGGFIGSALARALWKLSAGHLVLLDVAEAGLHDLSLQMECDSGAPFDLVVGDICDPALIRQVFERYRPQILVHAAACKHVTLMERNPFAAAKTNVLGSQQIAQSASVFGAEQLILISTDKAVEPAGIMGATKRISELIVLANRSVTKMKAVRLGNVYGSTGSVVPILRKQIARGGPLTITDACCERYFVSLEEAVRWILLACHPEISAALLAPRAGETRRIVDLAGELVADAGLEPDALEYRFAGLQPGEKLRERMISTEEIVTDSSITGLQEVVSGEVPTPEALDEAIEEIARSVEGWNIARLLRAVTSVVPRYRPSEYLQRRVESTRSARV